MSRATFVTICRALAVCLVLICALGFPEVVIGQSASTNYRLEETFFGTGGELDASSASYRAKQAAGELGVGNSSSTSYQTNAGFNTTDRPMLEFSVSQGTVDLGLLSASTTASTTATLSVRTYLSGGYVLTAIGDVPTNEGGSQLNALATPTASTVGAEQFGMNLRDNSTPNIGTDPFQEPDSTFSFGTVAAGYNTVNQFKYVRGDTIATSTRSSGKTTYTASYIYNITTLTKSGNYRTDQTFVVTSTF